METYIVSIIVTSIVCAFFCAACPADNGLNKFISLTASFIIVLVIVNPIKSFISGNELSLENFDSIDVSEIDYNGIAARTLSASVANSLAERFGCRVEKIVVNTLESEKFQIENVEVYIGGIVDLAGIKAYLEEQYSCEFIIVEG